MFNERSADASNLMVVVNLAECYFEFTDHSIYTCPYGVDDFKAGYKHYKARYAAIYVSKGAKYVAEVEAVILLTEAEVGVVLWKFADGSDEELVTDAKRRWVKDLFPSNGRIVNPTPCLVFLFGKKRRTEFEYDLQGGLQNSRQYFDLSSLAFNDLDGLANELRQVTWSTLPKRNG